MHRIILNKIKSLLSKMPVFPAIILSLFVFVGLFGTWLRPHDPTQIALQHAMTPPFWQEGGSREFLLGTDQLGRDILSRLIHGSRVSMQVSMIGMAMAMGLGLPIGMIAGYFGGKVDNVLMRIVDAVQSFPSLLLALAITAALGPSRGNAMIGIGVVSIPVFARLIRGEALSIKELDYIAAARVLLVKTCISPIASPALAT